jgi:hypothetical protein
VTAYEHRTYWLYCNGDAYRCRQRLDSEPGEGLAALRKRAGKAGWTRVRSRLGRKYDEDFCPDHKPAEAVPAAGTGANHG